MNNEKLAELLNKVPATFLMLLYCGYLGYEYYLFSEDSSSPMAQKRNQIESVSTENKLLKKKIKDATEFYRALESKRVELRESARKLQEMKVTLSEELDIPAMIKLMITEAKKTGLNLLSLKPTQSKREEYYSEQSFDLAFRGAYVQLLLFLDRLSNTQKIMRVDNFEMHSTGVSTTRFAELEGRIQVKIYKYEGSNADEIASKQGPVKIEGGATTPIFKQKPAQKEPSGGKA